MSDATVLACINLHAVLRNLEDLCELDRTSREIIGSRKLAIRFRIRGLPALILSFGSGSCAAGKTFGGPVGMDLYFTGPEHFNLMIEGKKNPIPVKGFRYLGFLKNEFTALAARLSYYLKPSGNLLDDPEYLRINTTLTAYTAFFAIPEIAAYDPVGRLSAGRISDGIINIEVSGGPSVHITAKEGTLRTAKGPSPEARAFMRFDSMETANGILSGRLDSYACLGKGMLSIRGYIPMIDNLNKLLARVSGYLR